MVTLRPADYTYDEVVALFDVRPRIVDKVTSMGMLPSHLVGSHCLYDRDYVDGLHALLVLADEKLGRLYTELYYMEHSYAHADEAPGAWRRRKDIVRRCRALLEQGLIIDVSTLCTRLEAVARPSTVRTWVAKRRVATVKIAKRRYIGQTCAKNIEKTLGWETLHCAAARCFVSRTTLYGAYQRGEIEGVLALDGKIHLRPGFTWPPKQVGQELSRAAVTLGVDLNTLRGARRVGHIVAVRVRGRWTIPPEEIERWRICHTTINDGFEWLEKVVGLRSPRTVVSSSRVAHLLGIGTSLVSGWAKDDLLPFYPDGFSPEIVFRVYVGRYIEGLARFAANRPVAIQQVREYKVRCKAAGDIV